MVLDNVRIKENITPEEIGGAIEFIANSCFVNGTYNPYYQSFAERIAVVTFFLDGITFEDNDSPYFVSELDDVKQLVNKFLADPKYSKDNETVIMATVRKNVEQVIDFKKQRLIHGADAIEYIASTCKSVKDLADYMAKTISNIANIDISSITQEDIEMARELVMKLNNSGIELTTENISKIIKDAVAFDSDKASQEIIDAKNQQIKELSEELTVLKIKIGLLEHDPKYGVSQASTE